jgi:acyl phosphate:glycerol-3-phosphate acyltransferase
VGSGNVGGRNALDVTGKKWIGIVVVVIDILKGVVAVVGMRMAYPNDVGAVVIAMSAVVFGHCYPIWLRFQGGRGLATAAGVFIVVNWLWVAIWLALYFLSEKITKNVHAASVIGLVGTTVVMWLLPIQVQQNVIPSFFSVEQSLSAGLLVIAVCLSKHIEPLQKLYQTQ